MRLLKKIQRYLSVVATQQNTSRCFAHRIQFFTSMSLSTRIYSLETNSSIQLCCALQIFKKTQKISIKSLQLTIIGKLRKQSHKILLTHFNKLHPLGSLCQMLPMNLLPSPAYDVFKYFGPLSALPTLVHLQSYVICHLDPLMPLNI